MAGNHWLVGEVARITADIVDSDGAAVDPSTLRLKVMAPSGVVTVFAWPAAPEIERSGLGAFVARIPLLEGGLYAFRIETESPAGASEKTLSVRKSLFPN